MLGKISRKIVDRLLKKGTIIQEEYEVYSFGMEQLLTVIVDCFTAIFIGIVFGQVIEMLFFVCAFIIIRSYAGGYHASTPLRCYLLTTLINVIVLSVMKFIKLDMIAFIGLLVIASIVILLISPVDTENKPIDDIEYLYYRKKTIIVWSIEIIIALISAIFRFRAGTESIVYAQVVLSISLVCERIIQLKKER